MLAHALDQVEHVAGLHDAERRGRLVHEHDLARPGDRAADRDALALAAGHVGHGRARVLDPHAEIAERLVAAPPHRPLVEEAELAEQPGARELAAEEQVRRRVELGRQREVLVDGLDAELARGVRRGDRRPRAPSKRISPPSGGWTPTSVLTSVLLPAPLSPTSATTSCGYTVKLAPRSACTRPKLLTMSRASRTGSGWLTWPPVRDRGVGRRRPTSSPAATTGPALHGIRTASPRADVQPALPGLERPGAVEHEQHREALRERRRAARAARRGRSGRRPPAGAAASGGSGAGPRSGSGSRAARSTQPRARGPAEAERRLLLAGDPEAVPLEQHGHVGRLLQLDDQQARRRSRAACRRGRRPRRRPAPGRGMSAPSSASWSWSRTHAASVVGGDVVAEPDVHRGAGVRGADDDPGLGLPERGAEVLGREGAVRVDVDRQPLAGVEQLHEQRRVGAEAARRARRRATARGRRGSRRAAASRPGAGSARGRPRRTPTPSSRPIPPARGRRRS